MPTSFTPIDPFMVLVRPQKGEKIGAAARAMLNFGLEGLRITEPRDGWPNPKAVAMASGAGRLLDHAGVFGSLTEAVADCHYVFATTARGRELTKPVLTPETAMAQARAMVAEGKRVAVLFGPERTGLENEEVALANAIISVPVNPAFASLNLAQCVLLTAYEWRRQRQDLPQAAPIELATGQEVARLGDHFEERLTAAGFFFPEDKAPNMKLNLRSMWSRLGLTRAEVQTFHGMLRQIARKLKGQDQTED
ncbi:MAG: RNA methyltransferase [Gemmobacter sp.]|nr:RNA methyltransferase [Gemmobacter sp.]